jgi:hypothetical protein
VGKNPKGNQESKGRLNWCMTWKISLLIGVSNAKKPIILCAKHTNDTFSTLESNQETFVYILCLIVLNFITGFNVTREVIWV